jgi:hypothetical protein
MDIQRILKEIDRAYPEDIFPEPTKEQIDEVHSKHPGVVDRISASMGRHLAGLIRRKLEETDEEAEGL